MTMRKWSLVLVAVAALTLVLALPSMAYANYAIHGSYPMSTDACAGCHRAHTAASPITWFNTAQEERSALLISTATDLEAFCYTCHGTDMTGADTNVYDGIYEANDGTDNDDTYNFFNDALNGGGFNPEKFPTIHYPGGVDWVAYGAGPDGRDGIFSTGGEQVNISCSGCHDVHGSSNYRLLKDVVAGIDPATGNPAGITVGGYDAAGLPTPFVISAEEGYPGGGFRKHEDGAVDVEGYFPDYTDGRYAIAPDGDPTKGISAWCATCHTQYNTAGHSTVVRDTDSTDDLGQVGGTDADYTAQWYDANDGFGYAERHRHPVNVPLSRYLGAGGLQFLDPATGVRPVPVANSGFADSLTNEPTDWVDCLTCHVAHGSGALMTGYAAVTDVTDPLPDSSYGETPGDGLGSVPPDDGNALLRGNNRYVCESCHNK